MQAAMEAKDDSLKRHFRQGLVGVITDLSYPGSDAPQGCGLAHAGPLEQNGAPVRFARAGPGGDRATGAVSDYSGFGKKLA